MQLNLFDAVRQPPIIRPINANGPVLQTDPDFTLTLAHPRMAWDRARIEIHQHTDGLWMWSTSFHADNHGSGYRVGAKWGKFAATKSDAIFHAVEELKRMLGDDSTKDANQIRDWLIAVIASEGQ